ncbi:hypothetical protein AAD018_015295 [Aestuariibius insulae]|uniref:hypothetical protein n=1 Tax=Aestuariibius insulae TaxID=2058287 RepID=UPI00345E472D
MGNLRHRGDQAFVFSAKKVAKQEARPIAAEGTCEDGNAECFGGDRAGRKDCQNEKKVRR